MITMRSHIVSLAAVFLALALGIVIGATKINSPLLVDLQANAGDLAVERDQLQLDNTALGSRVAGDDVFAADVSALAVRGTLPGAAVVLITTADADAADLQAVRDLLQTAGATVTADLQLTSAFTDPARADDLQSLVTTSLPAGVTLPEVADVGTLAGALLGAVLLSDEQGEPLVKAAEATAALSALSSAGFVTASGPVTAGSSVIVVTGSEAPDGSEAERGRVIAATAAQLEDAAAGVVVAGRSGSELETGPVGAIRGDAEIGSAVTTVDNVETATGRLATVLGLVEQNGGGVGRYGFGASAQSQIPALAVG